VGIAIYDGVQVLCETIWSSHDYHTVELAPAVEQILSRAGIELQRLELLAVATGPGSFTGLRIGLALAKGLALACHIPIIGIPTLDVVAESLPVSPGFSLAAVLQAGRGRLAVGWYLPTDGTWQLNPPIQVMDVQKLSHLIHQPTIVCGELTEEQQHALAKVLNVILASQPVPFAALHSWQNWHGNAGWLEMWMTLPRSPDLSPVGDPIPG
jgi:tRNA threonylcarbamoyladenosine biosynthesis protein TsaB